MVRLAVRYLRLAAINLGLDSVLSRPRIKWFGRYRTVRVAADPVRLGLDAPVFPENAVRSATAGSAGIGTEAADPVGTYNSLPDGFHTATVISGILVEWQQISEGLSCIRDKNRFYDSDLTDTLALDEFGQQQNAMMATWINNNGRIETDEVLYG